MSMKTIVRPRALAFIISANIFPALNVLSLE